MSACKQNEVAVIDICKEELLEELFACVVVPETVYLEATRPDKKASAST